MNREEQIHQLARDIFVRVSVTLISDLTNRHEQADLYAERSYRWAKAFMEQHVEEERSKAFLRKYRYARPGQGEGWFVEAYSDKDAIFRVNEQCDDVIHIMNPEGTVIWSRAHSEP